MAEKRMINKSISVSEKVNIGLASMFSRLLFTWMIPHTDDFGRMTGSPAKIKGLVVPMLYEITHNDVEKALHEMNEIGLVLWYEVSGEKYIQFRNFEEHQSGLHKRTKSKFPEPPELSRNFPELPLEEKGTELKGTEGNGREFAHNEHEKKIINLITELNITGSGVFGLDTILSFVGQVDLEIIEAGLKKAEGKHINYAVSVINGFIKEGKTTKESLAVVSHLKPPKEDKTIESRRREIAFQKYIDGGGDPNEFVYESASGY